MQNMFSRCFALVDLDLSNFATTNVTNTNSMFSQSTSIQKIDLRKADFSSVTNYSNMFYMLSVNPKIIVKDSTQKKWITDRFNTLTNVVVA